MDSQTSAVVRLAWSRALDLPDDALDTAEAVHHVVDDEATAVEHLELFGAGVLIGPADALAAARALSPLALADGFLLARTVGSTGLATVESLAYLDGYGDEPPAEDVIVSHRPDELAALFRRCPPDDVTEAALADVEHTFTLLDDNHTVHAAAGHNTRHGLLADVRALSALDSRRRGLATVAARMAAHDALDNGLVPQARIHPDNHGACRLAVRLGFVVCGRVTRVPLSP